MTDKEKMLAEIERLSKIEYPCDNSEQEVGYHLALDEFRAFVDSLTKEPVSEDLEEAFKQSFEKVKEETLCVYDYHAGFVDGAQWKENYMMYKAIEATMSKTDGMIWVDNTKDYDKGEIVKVIIIKKNEE